MIRAGALLLLLVATALGTAGCILAPVPGPVVGPAVVAPWPVVVAPRPHYRYHYGGYHRGYWRRGYGQHWH